MMGSADTYSLLLAVDLVLHKSGCLRNTAGAKLGVEHGFLEGSCRRSGRHGGDPCIPPFGLQRLVTPNGLETSLPCKGVSFERVSKIPVR